MVRLACTLCVRRSAELINNKRKLNALKWVINRQNNCMWYTVFVWVYLFFVHFGMKYSERHRIWSILQGNLKQHKRIIAICYWISFKAAMYSIWMCIVDVFRSFLRTRFECFFMSSVGHSISESCSIAIIFQITQSIPNDRHANDKFDWKSN